MLTSIALLWLAASPFFIQGSDPQFGMFTKDKDFVQETTNFEFFIANVNRLKPSFTIICGDLTNANTPAEIAEYHRIAKKLDPAIKFFSVAGNHDVGNDPTPASLALYRQNYGPDWYSFQTAGIYGIVLDTIIIKSPAKVRDEVAKQEAWLTTELAKAANTGSTVIVFQHIPWYLASPDEPDQYFNIPKQTREHYLQLLANSGVRAVFAGHYHRNAVGDPLKGMTMITTGPIGMPIGPDPSGFRIVSLEGNQVHQDYFGLGTVPNTYPPPAPEK